MDRWSPADWIELVKAIFFGIGAVCVPLATVYIMISAERLRKLNTKTETLNTKIDGMLVDRDEAKIKEGEQKERLIGVEKAAILAQGHAVQDDRDHDLPIL